jgi:hypothetical protein
LKKYHRLGTPVVEDSKFAGEVGSSFEILMNQDVAG